MAIKAQWKRRAPASPFTAAEDAELVRMVACGLASDFWHIGLPDRPFGEIADRRLQLIQAGAVARPRLI
jgi:hypothetical protein